MSPLIDACRLCAPYAPYPRPVMQRYVNKGDGTLELTELPYCAACKETLVDRHFEEQEGKA